MEEKRENQSKVDTGGEVVLKILRVNLFVLEIWMLLLKKDIFVNI